MAKVTPIRQNVSMLSNDAMSLEVRVKEHLDFCRRRTSAEAALQCDQTGDFIAALAADHGLWAKVIPKGLYSPVGFRLGD